MRILAGVLVHETNTLTPLATTASDFEVTVGAAMLERSPALATLTAAGATVVPSVYATALPSGRVERRTFDDLAGHILNAASSGPALDGVWLWLHGAMEVEGLGSGEAWLATGLREILGPDIPIAVALDFHANLTQDLISATNVIRGYRTAPHTDEIETQAEVARLLLRCIKEGLRPQPVMVRVPMVSPGDALVTTVEPGRSLMAELSRSDAQPGIMCASIFGGQPWVDAPNVGMSVVVTPDGDPQPAQAEAVRLARLCWDARHAIDFEAETADPQEALRLAMSESDGPVFVSDSGDNTTGGAPGDDAGFLGLMLETGVQDALFGGIADADVVENCYGLPPGSEVKTRLGGTLAPGLSAAIEVTGTLKHASRIKAWTGEDAGRCVVLALPGVDVLVTERRCGVVSREIMLSGGVDPLNYRIVVVKLGYLFDALRPIAKRAIIALTRGATCEVLEWVPYHRLRRPMFPLERDFDWEPAEPQS